MIPDFRNYVALATAEWLFIMSWKSPNSMLENYLAAEF